MAKRHPESSDRQENDAEELGQDQRIEKLRDQIRELTGAEMTPQQGGTDDPDITEQFLRNVLAVEEAGWTRPADHLTAGGLELPPAGELDDQELQRKLSQVIQAMALRNMYLTSTDHLSDRELYVELEEHLREETMMGPATPVPGFNFVIDLLGSGSDEHTYLVFKYYADDRYRKSWLEQFPDYDMPARVKPPHDRDRFLPQPDWTPPDLDDDDEPLM